MSGITGLGTTFTLPNYHGMLIGVSPEDTPFLSAIGGLTPGSDQVVQSDEFGWQVYDLRDAENDRQRKEGQDAPTAEQRVRAQLSNICEIHQEQVAVSYSKLAQVQRLAGLNVGGQSNPVTDEAAWQIAQVVKQKARDVEATFLTGSYQKPNDNTTERKTRGLIEAIEGGLTVNGTPTANVVHADGTDDDSADVAFTVEADDETFTSAGHGLSVGDQVVLSELTDGDGLTVDTVYYIKTVADANSFTVSLTPGGATVAVTADGSGNFRESLEVDGDSVIDLLQLVWENGGIQESETATLICGAYVKRGLTREFITDKNYQEVSRNVGGVNLQTFETDFGRLNIMLDRYQPAHKLVVASLEECEPKFVSIPDKGVFFVEPLAKTGAQEKSQLYGEVGLKYGNPLAHGLQNGLKVRA